MRQPMTKHEMQQRFATIVATYERVMLKQAKDIETSRQRVVKKYKARVKRILAEGRRLETLLRGAT